MDEDALGEAGDYDYELPAERIAQEPLADRSAARGSASPWPWRTPPR